MSGSSEAGRFADRVVIVTGGGGGIGRATATRFAAEGGLLAVADIDVDAAERTVVEIREAGGVAEAHQVDVSA